MLPISSTPAAPSSPQRFQLGQKSVSAPWRDDSSASLANMITGVRQDPNLAQQTRRDGAHAHAWGEPSEGLAAQSCPRKVRALANQIRTMGSWNNDGGDVVSRLLPELPGWPKGRVLTILGRNKNYYERQSFGQGQSDRAPVLVLLQGDHYSAVMDGREIPVPPDGNCFYHAVLASLGADVGGMKQQLGLPGDASDKEVIRALRGRLADYVQANPQLVEPYLSESSPPQVRVAWAEFESTPDTQAQLDEDEYDPYDDIKDPDDVIEAYKAEKHDDHPVWHPKPGRPWAEPLLQLITMGMPVFHNLAQGRPLLGPLPEPRKNDLVVDDPSRRVYALLNNATNRERLIDDLNRTLDEWQQSPKYIAGRDRDVLVQGRALTAELEDSFANPLREELAAKTLDYFYRYSVYFADNFNDLHSTKRDREAGSRSLRGQQRVQAPNPMRETGSRRASEAVPAFATSAGLSALEAQNAPLLGATLAGLSMTNPNLKAGAFAAAGVTFASGAAAAAYGLYRRLTRDSAPADTTPGTLVDDESHDDEVVANLKIPPELEASIFGTANAPVRLARSARSASRSINQPKSADGYKPNFSKYDDHVAENLRRIWDQSGNYDWARDDDTVRLMIFNGKLNTLINHDDKPSSRISDHLMFAAIREFDALRLHLEGLRSADSRVDAHLAYMDEILHVSGVFSKVPLYRAAFAVNEIDDDLYASQRPLTDNFIYRRRGPGDSTDGIANMPVESIYSRGIRLAEQSFVRKMSDAISATPPEMLPNAFAKIYKDEIYSHGRELVDYFIKKRGFTSNADYKDGLPSDLESDARIELTNVKKYHALTLFAEAMADHAIYKKLKEYGISSGQYGGYQALLEAKRSAAKLVIEKFGIDASGKNFDADDYIDAYNQILINESISDEVKQYLLKSASMAFYMVCTDELPAHLAWHTDMLEDFYSSVEHQLPVLNLANSRPDDHIDIGSFKRSNECSSKEEYFNQFVEYKKSSLAYDAKSVALNMLHAAGLTEYDISAMKPVAALGADLRLYWSYSRGLGELLKNGGDWRRNYIDINDPREGGNYIKEPHAYGGPNNAVGKMAFVEMADGRMIAIAVINGKSKAKAFSADQVRSSRVLQKIRASMQSGLPKERDDQGKKEAGGRRGSSRTSPYIDIEGKVLIDEVLKPLFGDEYKSIGFEGSHRGYVRQAFPQLTAAQNFNLDLSKNGAGLYPLATSVATSGLEEYVAALKGSLNDPQWWEYVIMFLPFAEEIYKYAVDKDHKVDGRSIAADVMNTIFSLVPYVGTAGKLSSVTTKVLGNAFTRAMRAGMTRGLTGQKLTMKVLAELAKEAPALRKVGLKALASAAYAAADVVSPVPPDLLVNPATRLTKNVRKYLNRQQGLSGQLPSSSGGRVPASDANIDLMNAAGDELEALGRTATIAPSADRSITLRASVLTPGQTIEENSALFEPLSRKQLSVMRADEAAPYSFDDLCAAPGRLQKRQVLEKLLNCFPFTSGIGRNDPGPRQPGPDASRLGKMSYNINLGAFTKIKLQLAKRTNKIQKFDATLNKFVDTDKYETVAVSGHAQLKNSRFPDSVRLRDELNNIHLLYKKLRALAENYSGPDARALINNFNTGAHLSKNVMAMPGQNGVFEPEIFVTLKKGGAVECSEIIGVAKIFGIEARDNVIDQLHLDFVFSHPFTIVNKYPDFRKYVIDKLNILPSELDNYQLKHAGLNTAYAGLEQIYDSGLYPNIKKITTRAINPITAGEFLKRGGVIEAT
ncbi:hypothetical protein [Burkholderia sp. HI2714]|uniref:hypothetical protein n=1 Tax=Burkholderia sp. HI2714 TaxID=2015359 RepID=UPI00117FED87|nr:hypothetical protein [Burkholderia sp. HI2714]